VPAGLTARMAVFPVILLLLPLICSANGIFSVTTSNNDCLIWWNG